MSLDTEQLLTVWDLGSRGLIMVESIKVAWGGGVGGRGKATEKGRHFIWASGDKKKPVNKARQK